MSQGTRTPPQYCPYCGGEDLRPNEAATQAWECRECVRVFTVSFVGLLNPAGLDSIHRYSIHDTRSE
jgi:transposase-like protein